jgi:hypothetical protein
MKKIEMWFVYLYTQIQKDEFVRSNYLTIKQNYKMSCKKSEQVVLRRSARLQEKHKMASNKSEQVVLRHSPRLQEKSSNSENVAMQKRVHRFVSQMKIMIHKCGGKKCRTNNEYLDMAKFFECVYENRDLLVEIKQTFVEAVHKKCKEFIEIVENMIPNVKRYMNNTHTAVYEIFPYNLAHIFGVAGDMDEIGFKIINSGIIKLYSVATRLQKYLETELSME